MDFEKKYEEVQQHLDSHYQNWLFGAGISFESNIPLMIPLTKKITADLKDKELRKVYIAIQKLLPQNAHIEHILSQIGDLIAIIERSYSEEIKINNFLYTLEGLSKLYKAIIERISHIVRYGYKSSAPSLEGSIQNPIVTVNFHQEFVKALFKRSSDLHQRKKVNFFTTNYDTLLEDALSLEKKLVIDGFSGSAIGFWDPTSYKKNTSNNEYHVYKLHGSIDWFNDPSYGLIRTRYGTNYLSELSNVLIYPQATKYVETQKDPFATLFNAFREQLRSMNQNVLCVCGYSFGDNHINNEIEGILFSPNNNMTLVIFIKETWNQEHDDTSLSPILNKWLSNSTISDRIFVLTEKGIYNGGLTAYSNEDQEYDWWSFNGLIKLLKEEE